MSIRQIWHRHLGRILQTCKKYNNVDKNQQYRYITRSLLPLVSTEETSELSNNELTTYDSVMEKYNELSAKAHAGGGPKGIERHVVKNKKVLVRDRIKMLIDPGTNFLEIGHLAGFDMMYGDVPCGGTVGGIGRVGGIYCMIGGNDATVKGGTYFPITVKKSHRTQEMAELNRLPCIYMPDSGGAFLPLQAEIFIPGGRSFYNQAVMSSKNIPQIALVCGSCTAGGAYNPTMSDEAIIVDQIGKIYLGGPPLVRAATGEVVTEEDLGGAFMHSSVSGCTDYYAKDEKEAFEMCRDIVESLNMTSVAAPHQFDEPLHSIPSWGQFGGKEHLSKSDLYAILAVILDGSQFKEFKAFYGPGLITGVGSIEGMKVGIIANTDEILSSEALKAAHFLDMCSRRDIPTLFLQNSQLNHNTIPDQTVLKNRGKLSSMIANLNTPRIVVTLSACHEDDFLLMCGQSFNPNFHLMWPSAKLSTLNMERQDESDDPVDAFTAAANMLTDAIVLPENTRKVVGEILRILSQQKLNRAQAQARPVFRM